ncbi:MAG: hypothetical protein KDD61_08740 [Bdellovibrionales bacterium]|nr:hypothetical protein [Bdellovibrionales bacterium]
MKWAIGKVSFLSISEACIEIKSKRVLKLGWSGVGAFRAGANGTNSSYRSLPVDTSVCYN